MRDGVEEFLQNYNGVSFWWQSASMYTDIKVNSDAVGDTGFGVYWQGWRCAAPWHKT